MADGTMDQLGLGAHNVAGQNYQNTNRFVFATICHIGI